MARAIRLFPPAPTFLRIHANFPAWTSPSPVAMLRAIGQEEHIPVDACVRMWQALPDSMRTWSEGWIRTYITRETLLFPICVERVPVFHLRTLALYAFLAFFYAQDECASPHRHAQEEYASRVRHLKQRLEEKSAQVGANLRARQAYYPANFHCMPMCENTRLAFGRKRTRLATFRGEHEHATKRRRPTTTTTLVTHE